MDKLWQDLQFGFRSFAKNPGFTAIAVLALTLGIGANSAIFSVVNAVLLRPLPYEQSNRLVLLRERSNSFPEMSIAYPNYVDWRAQNTVFEELGIYRSSDFNLVGTGEPIRINGSLISASALRALRVKPMLGRTFTEDEDKPNGNNVTILSYGLWQNHFGGDKNIVGKTVNLSDNLYTVIGVMAADYDFPSKAELWVPAGARSNDGNWVSRGNHPGLRGIARLKDGVTLDQAKANLDVIAINLEKQYPDSNTSSRLKIDPMLDRVVKDIRPALYILLGAVGLVLLIACANVANLMLARAAARQKEIAIRIALGANRLRLIRQLLTESLLLSIAGGALGLILARWGVQLLVKVSPNTIPRASEIALDFRVVLFTLGVCVLTGLLFGLVPALQFSKADLNAALKESGRGSTGGMRSRHFRNAMIVSEIAMSMVLLIAAGLLIRSFYHLLQVDPGFNPQFAISMQINLPARRYSDSVSRINFFHQVMDRVSNLPSVQVAGMGSRVPFDNNDWQSSFSIEGRPDPPNGNYPSAEINLIDPNYFRAMGISLIKGREFSIQDNKESPFVAIIDESFARQYWPNEDPIGKRIHFWSDDPKEWPTVVGIVKRIKLDALGDDDTNRVHLYLPFYHHANSSMTVVVEATAIPQT